MNLNFDNVKEEWINFYKNNPKKIIYFSILLFIIGILSIFGKLDDCILIIITVFTAIFTAFIALLPFLLYLLIVFIPVIVAKKRNHSNIMPIVLLTLFLGWTIIGWIIALIWATTDNTNV